MFTGREGQEVTILWTITHPDATHDEEVLPMYVARFSDGHETELFPDEIEWDGE